MQIENKTEFKKDMIKCVQMVLIIRRTRQKSWF